MIDLSTHFWGGALAMGLPTVAFAYMFATDPRNRLFHAMLVGITGIASVAYVLMALGLGQYPGANGETVFVLRYVDWMLTTPLIIAYLCLLAGVRRRVLVVTTVLDAVMIGLGLGAHFAAGAVRYALFGLASVVFVGLLYYLVRGIMEAVRDRPEAVVTLFEKLRNLTVVVWGFYPVLWILGNGGVGVLDLSTQVLLFSYLDVVSKAVFGFIILNSRQSLDHLQQLDALRITNTFTGGAD